MKNPQQRSQALDVLRGLTLALMIVVNMPGSAATTYGPFLHAPWHGLTLTDLVFPTFMFVVGTALSFTLEKYQDMGDGAVLKKIFTRTALIFLCGYLLSWFPFFQLDQAGRFTLLPVADTRILGVLQRIALGYCVAALILHYWKLRGALVFSALALLGYWWIMHAFGDYTLAGIAGIKLDKLILGESHMYHGEGVAFDPEGILSTLPSIVNVLAGYCAGRIIRERGQNLDTLARLVITGGVCIAIALGWDAVFPINKKLWTSSYVMCTIGIDLVLLSFGNPPTE
jgi:predicted acyltransferase